MLFTVNRSPFETHDLESCLKFANNDTPILLYENGVYGAAVGTSFEPVIKEALKSIKIYVLGPDLAARAIEKTVEGIDVIDYSGFVELAEKHNVCAWI